MSVQPLKQLNQRHKRFAREYHEFMSQKMLALDQLGLRMGMWGPLRSIFEQQGEAYPENPALCAAIKEVLDSPILSPYSRQALMRILDYDEPDWRDAVSLETLGICVDRKDRTVKQWRDAVLRRDNNTCQDCGSQTGLHAHHLMPWATAPHMRLLIEHGITLCASCHANRHEDMSRFLFVHDDRELPVYGAKY